MESRRGRRSHRAAGAGGLGAPRVGSLPGDELARFYRRRPSPLGYLGDADGFMALDEAAVRLGLLDDGEDDAGCVRAALARVADLARRGHLEHRWAGEELLVRPAVVYVRGHRG